MKTGSNGKIKRRFKRRRGGGLRGWLWGSLECSLRSPSYLILQFLKNNTVMDYGVVRVVRAAQRRLVRSHVATRLISSCGLPPRCHSCLRCPGTKVTCSTARRRRLLVRSRVTARPLVAVLVRITGREGHSPAPLPPLMFALSGRRKGDLFARRRAQK